MTPSGNLTLLNAGPGSPQGAFAAWIAARKKRGKTAEETARYVMKVWLDFAWNKVKTQAPPAKKEAIYASLMQIVSTYTKLKTTKGGKPMKRKASRAEQMYRGTLAERIVRALDWKGARGMTGAARFKIVGSFVKARQFAARHHMAAFYPGYTFLKKTPGERAGPRYQKHPSGTAEGKFTDTLAEIMVENLASSAQVPGRPAPLGIGGLVPGTFEDSLAEVMELLGRKALEDAMRDGKAAAGSVFTFTGV